MSTLSAYERAGEVLGIERAQIVQSLADSDQLHRQPELVGDCDRDAALGRAVQRGERDSGHVDRLSEEPRLLQAVLSGGRIDDEQRLVRGALEPLADHPPDL